MASSAEGDRLAIRFSVPDASRSNFLLRNAEAEAHCRIITELRAMYADLVAEPVPDRLLQLIRAFELRQEGERHDA